jgi:hypothetical protein
MDATTTASTRATSRVESAATLAGPTGGKEREGTHSEGIFPGVHRRVVGKNLAAGTGEEYTPVHANDNEEADQEVGRKEEGRKRRSRKKEQNFVSKKTE